jgi:hypothetical protein
MSAGQTANADRMAQHSVVMAGLLAWFEELISAD